MKRSIFLIALFSLSLVFWSGCAATPKCGCGDLNNPGVTAKVPCQGKCKKGCEKAASARNRARAPRRVPQKRPTRVEQVLALRSP